MKNILLVLFIVFSPICAIGQEDLSLKCIDLDGFALNNQVILDSIITINISNDGYNIQYYSDFTSMQSRDTIIGNTIFFEYILPQWNFVGFNDSIGLPKLPYLKFTLQIPSLLYNTSLVADNIHCTYDEYYVSNFYYPFQDNIEENGNSFFFNEKYYTKHNNELIHYVDISEPFKAGNTTGLSVIIHPIQYNPVLGKVRIINNLSFDIPLEEVQLSDIFAYELENTKCVIDVPFFSDDITFPFDENFLGKLLIIVGKNSYREHLLDFIQHKQNLGFDTEIISVDEILALTSSSVISAEVIRGYLKNRYYNETILNRPKFLLLVGDYDIIPYSYHGVDYDNLYYAPYHTDIYYGCLEDSVIRKDNNLYPEIFVGRWPVYSESDIDYIVHKTMLFETYHKYSPLFSNILMLSGTDSDGSGQDKYNTIVSLYEILNRKLFQSIYYYDGRNYLNSTDAIQNILRQYMLSDLFLFVYKGHGFQNSLSSPIYLFPPIIKSFKFSSFPPLFFAFACLSSSYSPENMNFGQQWLRANNAGGVIYYGATGYSFSQSSEYLAQTIFKNFSMNENITIGEIIQSGAAKLCYGSNSDRLRCHVEKYIIYGDPSLIINLSNGVINYSHANTICSSQIVSFNELREILYKQTTVTSLFLYDLSGKIIF